MSENALASPIESILGPQLLSKVNGELVATSKALDGKDLVAVYFSAKWCPPCKVFSGVLKQFYSKCDGKHIEVVYVSSDRSLTEFDDYFGTMPWMALDRRTAKAQISQLQKKCKIMGIPTLMVLDAKTGNFITDQARNEVSSAASNQDRVLALLEEWKSRESVPLEQASFSSPSACHIL